MVLFVVPSIETFNKQGNYRKKNFFREQHLFIMQSLSTCFNLIFLDLRGAETTFVNTDIFCIWFYDERSNQIYCDISAKFAKMCRYKVGIQVGIVPSCHWCVDTAQWNVPPRTFITSVGPSVELQAVEIKIFSLCFSRTRRNWTGIMTISLGDTAKKWIVSERLAMTHLHVLDFCYVSAMIVPH